MAVSVLLSSGLIAHAAEPPDLLKNFARSNLTIETALPEPLLFDIYLATTAEQRRRGLMFVRSLEETEGMLFLYTEAATISMWMKNTYIPLDMVFIDANWHIASIHENAVPHSTSIIESGSKAIAVLELRGGAASRLGITTGDRVRYPADDN